MGAVEGMKTERVSLEMALQVLAKTPSGRFVQLLELREESIIGAGDFYYEARYVDSDDDSGEPVCLRPIYLRSLDDDLDLNVSKRQIAADDNMSPRRSQ